MAKSATIDNPPVRTNSGLPRSGKTRKPVRWGRVAIVGVGLTIVANLLIMIAFTVDTGEVTPEALPSSVLFISPTTGSVVRPQESVSVQLAEQFTGVLQIDGQEIPLDQIDSPQGQNVITFRPGADKDIDRFEPGSHRATVIYWRATETRSSAASFSWTFGVA